MPTSKIFRIDAFDARTGYATFRIPTDSPEAHAMAPGALGECGVVFWPSPAVRDAYRVMSARLAPHALDEVRAERDEANAAAERAELRAEAAEAKAAMHVVRIETLLGVLTETRQQLGEARAKLATAARDALADMVAKFDEAAGA